MVAQVRLNARDIRDFLTAASAAVAGGKKQQAGETRRSQTYWPETRR
jgi:hypothetical protein